MLDLNILKLMFKEEFRLQASFFNRSYFLFSSLTIVLFTFIMGATLPMLRHAVAIDDLLLVAHWVLLFYGLGVGGFLFQLPVGALSYQAYCCIRITRSSAACRVVDV
ncbi:MAG: hypothetical protein KKD46_06860 [Euryarchaeota archaeon]|nr:hypothetical protein [Euryarchaeota archaeon]MBU4340618.1 hypothetical protein [Euryarchaeota archaeon]MCG2737706.1 hypothetical protein [Candidatus Methanoperedenaceae archaeon]